MSVSAVRVTGGESDHAAAVRLSVSVVVCAYTTERWDHLEAAVESLAAQTRMSSEIILVIDHNEELLARARHRFRDARVVRNAGPRGISGARNTGVAEARGDVIAFLDDDAEAAPDWIEMLLSAYTRPSVLGVGGLAEPVWEQGRPAWFPQEFGWVVGCSYRGLPTTRSAVRNPIGCNMSARRSAFHRAGGFAAGLGRTTGLPLGAEETEWYVRAAEIGPASIVLHEPRARVRHHVPPERHRWRYFVRRCYAEGVSKAVMSRMVGQRRGLASEVRYTSVVLTTGFVRELARGILQLDPARLARAGALVVGLAVTSAGYVVGRAKSAVASRGIGGTMKRPED